MWVDLELLDLFHYRSTIMIKMILMTTMMIMTTRKSIEQYDQHLPMVIPFERYSRLIIFNIGATCALVGKIQHHFQRTKKTVYFEVAHRL